MKKYKLYDLSNMKFLADSNDFNVINLIKKYNYKNIKNFVIFKYDENIKKYTMIRMWGN